MINGNLREEATQTVKSTGKYIGVFQSKVKLANPNKEQLGKLLGVELENEYEYLGETPEGFKKLTLSIWSQDTDGGRMFNTRFYLIEKERESMNNPGSFQYINSVGACSWAKSEDMLPVWFTTDRTWRKAYVGEEEVHEFMRAWLNKLDFKNPATHVLLDTKKMFSGDVSEFQNAIENFKDETLCQLACVRTVVKEDGEKHYQAVYNKKFLPGSFIKSFKEGKTIKSKLYDNFVSQIQDPQHGLKDKYSIEYIHGWEPGAETVVSKPAILNKDQY